MTENRRSSSITYLSQPQDVSMADEYFDIAKPDHFWVKRRFEVFSKLIHSCGLDLALESLRIGEIGCGHGLVQYQLGKYYGVQVDGFDLNEIALQKSIATDHSLFLYDIYQRNENYHDFYDLLILFDVIEHIRSENDFIESTLYHLKPEGILAINVPALPVLYSQYDAAAGHVKRYTLRDLNLLGIQHKLRILNYTYWGFSLLPLILIRKLLLNMSNKKDTVYNSGFVPPSSLGNQILYWLSQLEVIPQTALGTSLMIFYQKGK